jgi:hypothetical protein
MFTDPLEQLIDPHIRKKANPLLDALAAFQNGERGKAAKR